MVVAHDLHVVEELLLRLEAEVDLGGEVELGVRLELGDEALEAVGLEVEPLDFRLVGEVGAVRVRAERVKRVELAPLGVRLLGVGGRLLEEVAGEEGLLAGLDLGGGLVARVRGEHHFLFWVLSD